MKKFLGNRYIYISLILLSLIIFNVCSVNAENKTVTVTAVAKHAGKGIDPHTNSTDIWDLHYRFQTSSGQLVFCADHSIPAYGINAVGDSQSMTFSEYNASTQIRKILYYGWGGPEQWSGFDNYADYNYTYKSSFGVCLTSTELCWAYNNQTQYNYNSYGQAAFRNFINSQPAPPSTFKIYKFYTSNAYQTMFMWEYNPAGKIKIIKQPSY